MSYRRCKGTEFRIIHQIYHQIQKFLYVYTKSAEDYSETSHSRPL